MRALLFAACVDFASMVPLSRAPKAALVRKADASFDSSGNATYDYNSYLPAHPITCEWCMLQRTTCLHRPAPIAVDRGGCLASRADDNCDMPRCTKEAFVEKGLQYCTQLPSSIFAEFCIPWVTMDDCCASDHCRTAR